MDDIDEILKVLRTAPVPDHLTQIDGPTLAFIGRARSIEARNITMIAAAMALFVGVASSALPSAPAEAAIVTPFALAPPLAPSSLLASQP